MNDLEQEVIATFDVSDIAAIVTQRGFSAIRLDIDKLRSISTGTVRTTAESRKDLVQIVSVFVVRFDDQIFVFKKSKKSPEARLHHTYSMIFGGHVLWYDLAQVGLTKNSPESPNLDAFIRELNEELRFDSTPKITYQGLVYIDSDEVSKQHLGVVYLVECTSANIQLGEKSQMFRTEFMSLEKIINHSAEFDKWSVCIAENLKDSLNDSN